MEIVSRARFIDEIRELLNITRGRELPGMFNPLIVGDLFLEQSRPWERLARQHLRNVWQAARSFLDLLVSHLADEPTSEALLGQVIDPLMDQKLKSMNRKLDEILRPYQTGHPITYNHYFTETIQKVRGKRHEAEIAGKLRSFLGHKDSTTVESVSVKNARIPSLLSALTSRTEADMDRYACAEILDCMEAYYKVAMKSVIDNVAVHAIEYCLIAGLSDLLSPSYVLQMDKELVCGIAAESHQNRDLREQTQQQLVVLQAGLDICRVQVNRKTLSRAAVSKIRFVGSQKWMSRSNMEGEDAETSSDAEQSSQEDLERAATGLPDSITISSDLEIVSPANHVKVPQIVPPTEPDQSGPLFPFNTPSSSSSYPSGGSISLVSKKAKKPKKDTKM